MTDRETVRLRLDKLRHYQKQLEGHRRLPWHVFKHEKTIQSAVQYLFILAIQCCLVLVPFQGFAADLSKEKWSLKIMPDKNLMVEPGATVGWGYTIGNYSGRYWLVTTNLNSDSYLDGEPLALFDFPSIPPGGAVTLAYDPSKKEGIYQFHWKASARRNFANYGEFKIDSEWWDGDPLHGGKKLGDAMTMKARYFTMTNR